MRLIIHKRATKLSIFDLMVGGLIILLVLSLVWFRLARKTTWITVRLVVTNDEWWWEGAPPQWWYAEGLSVGQTSRDSFGQSVAEIVNVENFDVGAYWRRSFVDMKLKGTYDARRQVYLFNYQPIQIGKPIDLTFGKNNIRGVITYIENLPDAYTDKTIEVKMSTVRPWVADSYKPGLAMKDSQGRILAEVLSVRVAPTEARSVVEGASGKIGEIQNGTERTYDPSLFRDVTLRLRIKTFKSGEIFHFVDRAAIKIGEKIWFQFPQAVAREAEITEIFE